MSESAGAAQRKSPVKTIVMIAGMLFLEAGVIIGAMLMLGAPKVVSGAVDMPPAMIEEQKLVEVLVLDDKLPNNRSGITYLYLTEIYVQVRKKHEPVVAEELKRFQNEIRAEISAIWKTAEPRHFQEPMLENLTRKVQVLLDARFGVDHQTSEPIVVKCVIVAGTGFRVDG